MLLASAIWPRGRGVLTAARSFHDRRQEELVAEHGPRAVRGLREVLTGLSGGAREVRDLRLPGRRPLTVLSVAPGTVVA
jgi:hypothetical protein